MFSKPLPDLTSRMVQLPVCQCELFWCSAFEERYNYCGVMFPVDQPWANEEFGISGNEMHREIIMSLRVFFIIIIFLQFHGCHV